MEETLHPVICLLQIKNFSSLLIEFCDKYKFNKYNLNAVNSNGVTPLTVAVELGEEEIIVELLSISINPLIENVHGNTPLYLSKNKLWFSDIINQAIAIKTCKVFNCELNVIFFYDNKCYIINKIIRSGSCSLVAMEIQDCDTSLLYFAKIKTCFGGFELRNYIFFDQYIDLFKIEKLILYNNQVNSDKLKSIKIYTNIYCLILKIIPGYHLSMALNFTKTLDEKKNIVIKSIQSLSNLHQQGYIHNDALPDNCLWDQVTQKANFIDFDVMRNILDLKNKDPEYISELQYTDFKSLIMGNHIVDDKINNNNQKVVGLMHYFDNIKDFKQGLSEFDDNIIPCKIKNKLLKNIIE